MKVEKKIILLIVILLVIALTIFLLMKPKELMAPDDNKNTDQASLIQKMEEVKIDVLQEGTGEVSKKGDTLTVNYTGTLTDGTQFDSSIGRAPFSFTLGENRVIQGWEQGMLGMKVGEKRKLTIPSDLGYGPQGYPGVIPGDATLIFEVELMKIN